MLLERGGNATPCAAQPSACPAGWSQVDLAEITDIGSNCRRTCYRADRACLVIRMERTDPAFTSVNTCSVAPAPGCPAGWSQADLQRVDKVFANCVRTCYFCP